MNALILLADGFETVEALQSADIFVRSHKIRVTLCSIHDHPLVRSSQNYGVLADTLLSEIDPKDFDFLVLPGGKLGVENLRNSDAVIALIHRFFELGKDVHAICAAPSILGELGYLDNLDYTCFPGFERGKGRYHDVGAVETPHIITGHSMGYTMEFAKAIVAHYFGEEGVNAILPGMMGIR